MERHGIAMAMDDGVQEQQPPGRVKRQALLMVRERGYSLRDQAIVVRIAGALDFLWRLFAGLEGYVARVRRLLAFKVAKDGSVKVKEDWRASKSENNVVESRVEAQCEPVLLEILVTSQEETTHLGISDVGTKLVEACHEDCASICGMESKDTEEPEPSLACVATEQFSCQSELLSKVCGIVDVILPELHGEDGIANEQQNCHSQEQTDSLGPEQNDGLCTADGEKRLGSEQDVELVDAAVNSKSDDQLQSFSRASDDNTENSQVEGGSDVESLDLAGSRVLKNRVSIKELNAAVAEQLTKFLHAVERKMVPGNAEHRRAIVLATLVAIFVWARNAKHLHESMPLMRGSAINVYIRSRL